MFVSWINHRNRNVLYLDLRNANDADVLKGLEEMGEALSGLNEKVPLLANVTGTPLSNEGMEELKQITKEVVVYKTSKTAIVGVSQIQSVLVKTYNFLMQRDLHVFSSEKEALEWLCSDDG